MSEIGYVKVDTNQLSDMTENLETYIGNLDVQKSDMEANVENLKMFFQSDSAVVFFAAIERNLQEFGLALENLKALLRYEKQANESYIKCETVVSGIVEELR